MPVFTVTTIQALGKKSRARTSACYWPDGDYGKSGGNASELKRFASIAHKHVILGSKIIETWTGEINYLQGERTSGFWAASEVVARDQLRWQWQNVIGGGIDAELTRSTI